VTQASPLADLIRPLTLLHITSLIALEKLTDSSQHSLVDRVIVLLRDEQVLKDVGRLINVKGQDSDSHAISVAAGR
jgi:hypothetical protein